MPFVGRRRRPRASLTSFSLAAATAALTSSNQSGTPNNLTSSPSSSSLSNSQSTHDKQKCSGSKSSIPSAASLSLLALQNPSFMMRTALVTWRKHSRIVEIRSNCLLIFRKPALSDLSNVDDVIVLTHNHHPYAVNSHVVCVDARHSFYFHHPRQATSFRAALLTITEASPPHQYYLLDSLNKSTHSAIHAAKKFSSTNPYSHHNNPPNEHDKLKHYNTYHMAEDTSSSNNSQSNSENSDIVGFNSDNGVGNSLIQRQYSRTHSIRSNKSKQGRRRVHKKVSITNHSTGDTRDSEDDIFVVKSISKLSLSGSDPEKLTSFNRFLSERLLLQKAASYNSPFIIRLIDAFETSRHYHLVTQLAHYGSLERVLNVIHETDSRQLSENTVRQIFSELVLALYDVHSCGYMYRNLTLRNILLDSKGHVKLNDFGIVKKVHIEYDLLNNHLPNSGRSMGTNNSNINKFYLIGRTTSFIVSDENNNLDYLSPEQVLNENNSLCNYGAGCDIWGLGIILYYLLVGCYPFEEALKNSETTNTNRLNWYILNKRIVAPNSINYISHNAMDLLHALLYRDEYNRIDIFGIMEHPWFSNVNWNEVRSKAQNEYPAESVLRSLRQSNVRMLDVQSSKHLYDDDDSLKEMIFQQQRRQRNTSEVKRDENTDIEKRKGGNRHEMNSHFNDWTTDEFHKNEFLLGFNFVQ